VIIVNGSEWERDGCESVVAVLERLGLAPDARGVAVAIDGEVVPRTGWNTFAISDGARVEVLRAMQGG
jgi:sulfur carrier protein